MRPADIDRFFSMLAAEFPYRATVILTGGGAAILEGVSRATRDLDFQIQMHHTTEALEAKFLAAVQSVERRTGIDAQFDDAIESWSSISWPDPKPKSRTYKRFGRIEVRILDPLWWSIGKIARFLSYDISDVVTVFRTMKVNPQQTARAWGRALGRSPLSNAQPIFQRQALEFLRRHGRALWGATVDVAALEAIFLRTARSTRRKRSA